MKYINRQFTEFKSIFVSEDLLKENEEHANIVTASTMMNVFWISVISWVLVFFNIFKLGLPLMNKVMIRSILLLLIPSLICFYKKGKGKWIKHLLFISFIILLAMTDAMLKYNITLVIVIPIILAARYYNKKFTISLSILTTVIFAVSTFMSINIGPQDLNSYNLVIPEGTTITVNETLRDSITSIEIDESERLRNIFIHFYFPKILLFNIVAFACVQVSQSGKNMLLKQKEITEEGERINTELHLANEIQKNMLPSIFPPFPEHKEFDIYASMTPAKEVGGDFYDMFLIDDNHLAICIADVSGKGVPASLVMMISKILIKNVSKIDVDVSKAFTRVNNMLCDGNNTNIFITSWLGVLDLKSGKLEFVNAGHNPPLLYSKEKNQFEYLKTKPNMVLAGIENSTYTKNEINIKSGDRLFLYTDGVTESFNAKDELYGEERLKDFLNNHIHLNVEETIKELKKDIDNFVGGIEQSDDITMLELSYNGKAFVEEEFQAQEEELENVQQYVENFMNNYEIDLKKQNQIQLVVEEIFINISKYAYQDGKGKCKITLQIDSSNNFVLTFEDNGILFNPLEAKDVDTSLSLEEREIGGLGIFITKKLMDNMEYKYENNKNILTIKKVLRGDNNDNK